LIQLGLEVCHLALEGLKGALHLRQAIVDSRGFEEGAIGAGGVAHDNAAGGHLTMETRFGPSLYIRADLGLVSGPHLAAEDGAIAHLHLSR
jgi:hypothetical protein